MSPRRGSELPGLPDTFANGDGKLHDDGAIYNLDVWKDWEWFAFRNAFPRVIKDFWDEKFELTPNRPWFRPLPHQELTAPKVTCSLDIKLVPGTGAPAIFHHQTRRRTSLSSARSLFHPGGLASSPITISPL